MPLQTIDSQLQMLLSEAGDDFDKAEATLAKRPELRRHVLKLGWEAAHQRSQRTERTELKHTPIVETALVQSSPGQVPRRKPVITPFAKSVVNEARHRLLTNFTVGGVPLGECTDVQLLADAMVQRQQGDGHYRNADFEERLAAVLARNQQVRDLTDGTIEAARIDAFENVTRNAA